MTFNCLVFNRYTLRSFALLLIGALFYAELNAQDRFPAPGQPQAGTPMATHQNESQQIAPHAFPSQSGMQGPSMQQPQTNIPPPLAGQSGQSQQQPGHAGGRGGFQMPSSPGQAQPTSPLAQRELQDFGVPPTAQLHAGAMHGPTPVKIPGGRVTTTDELAAALSQGQQQVLLFHVLGGQETLPNAQYAAPASAPGTFNDETQRAFSQYLGQVTQGQKSRTLVFYCASVQCWMSYNAALRAINSGYSNVLWYRGGIEAWKAAGLPTSRQQ